MHADRASPKSVLLSNSLWLGLALIVLPALVVVATELYQLSKNVPELRRSQELVAHTIEVRTAAQKLERAIQDAEQGQRGFLITGDPAYLEFFRTGERATLDALSKLERLTVDNPEQQGRWPILERQINIKLDELKRSIEVRRTSALGEPPKITESNSGAMRAIEQTIDAANAAEDSLLKTRQALGEEAAQRTATVSLIEAGATLLIILAGSALLSANFYRIGKSEQALSASEDRFRGLLESAPDAMVIADQSGAIVLVNAQTEQTFGYSRQELIGKPVEVLVPARFAEQHVRHRSAFLSSPVARAMGSGLKLYGRRKDGSEFPVEVSLSPRWTTDGVLVTSAIRDISERKKAEAALAHEREERERAEGMLRQAQKMEALGQLTGGIAHDFNNMLGVIVGSLDTLQRRLRTDDPKLSSPIQSAMLGAQRSAALTQSLLAFSRQQPLEPKPVDVNKLVAAMSSLLGRTLGEGVETETVLAAGLWTVSADINQLENALLNLAVNARDAMPNGGKLTIETANVYFDEVYANAHGEVAPGQYVMVAVTDNGVGMSDATIERAFEPFFTTKELGHGTGLGLSQVYGFIKQSAGHVKIYSASGEGTTVKLYLPRAASQDVVNRENTPRPLPTQPRSQTILAVEDNELLLDSVATMLREHGYRVLTALNGADALRLLDAEENVRLLFTDLGLPGGMNGRELADEACRRRPGLVALFTTGYTRNAIFHQGRLDAGVEFIGKPFTHAALVAKIEQLLEAAG